MFFIQHVYITDALQTDVWKHFQTFQNPRLLELANNIPELLKNIRRPNTLIAYSSAYRRFEEWTADYQELPSFPTNEYAVTLYVMNLIQQEKTLSVVQQYIAATNWIHELGGYKTPTENSIVKAVLESAKRGFITPTVHKLPVTTDIHCLNKVLLIRLQI